MSVSSIIKTAPGTYTTEEMKASAAVVPGQRVKQSATSGTVDIAGANDYDMGLVEHATYGTETSFPANRQVRVVYPYAGCVLKARCLRTGGIAIGDKLGPSAAGALAKITADFEKTVAVAREATTADAGTFADLEVIMR